MFKNHLDECINKCLTDLRGSKEKEIKDLLIYLDTNLPSNIMENITAALIKNTLAMIMFEGLDSNEVKKFIVSKLSEVVEGVNRLRCSYKFKVSLKGLDKEIYRIICVSSEYTLADLGYIILASMKAEGSHLFCFNIKKQSYRCETERELEEFDCDLYAADFKLHELNLKEKQTFGFFYDYGDSFDFKVTLQKIIEDGNMPLDSEMIIDGKGYGIWEDEHYALHLYHSDYNAFKKYAEECGVNENDFPINETFDLEECREYVSTEFEILKKVYENPNDFSIIERSFESCS